MRNMTNIIDTIVQANHTSSSSNQPTNSSPLNSTSDHQRRLIGPSFQVATPLLLDTESRQPVATLNPSQLQQTLASINENHSHGCSSWRALNDPLRSPLLLSAAIGPSWTANLVNLQRGQSALHQDPSQSNHVSPLLQLLEMNASSAGTQLGSIVPLSIPPLSVAEISRNVGLEPPPQSEQAATRTESNGVNVLQPDNVKSATRPPSSGGSGAT